MNTAVPNQFDERAAKAKAILDHEKTRFFIYFRHTPRGVELFCSRKLVALGIRTPLMGLTDPSYVKANAFLSRLMQLARNARQQSIVPVASHFKPHVEEAAAYAGVTASFLEKSGNMPTRILVQD